MKPRVAIVLPYFGSGGAENMVSRLASHLDLSRIDAEVICLYGEPMKNRLEQAVTDHGVPIRYIGKGKGFSLSAMQKLWKELSAFRPTVIHTHLSACVYCAPWSLCHRVVMLHTIHSMPQHELIKKKQRLMSFAYKTGYAIPVAISREIQSLMIPHYHLRKEPELIYNPVDVAKFTISRRAHQKLKLITVGRLSAEKNQKILIDAMQILSKRHPDLQLDMLGDGPLLGNLTMHVAQEQLQDRIYFAGNVDNVEEYLAEADIFVLSSDYEGLPLVILEAMAAGLPIVSTNVGGVKDIVSNNGILVPPGNLDGLVQAIERLIQDQQLRTDMGINSRRNVVDFDSPKIANQYANLYKKYSK